jgi:NTE family protein
MTRDVVFPGGLLAQARTLQRIRARLFPNSGLAAVIAGFLGAATSFAELAVPFGTVTTESPSGSPT